jgi:hypothetical protein
MQPRIPAHQCGFNLSSPSKARKQENYPFFPMLSINIGHAGVSAFALLMWLICTGNADGTNRANTNEGKKERGKKSEQDENMSQT